MDKKSNFRVVAEAIAFDRLKDVKLSTNEVDYRKLTVDEIKEVIKEEFDDVKDVEDVEAEEMPRGWGDDVLEKEIEWIKKLDIQEYFKKNDK